MTFGDALALMLSALSVADLERTGVTYEVLVGDEYINANGAPPRIVIVPQSSQMSGPRLQATPGARSLAGETHLFTAELWAKGAPDDTTKAKDYIAASVMKATFIAAMRAAFGTNFQLSTGQWGEISGESLEEDGRSFLQQFTLSAISLDSTTGVATVAHTTTNLGLSDPGDDFTNP